MAEVRFIFRTFFTVLWVLTLLPAALLFATAGLQRAKHKVIQLFHSVNLVVWGVRVRCRGELIAHGPALIVSNHVSYLDVPVLASLSAMMFVPKAEIASWPVVGALSRLCDVIFVERRASRTGIYKDILRARLEKGEVLCLFPEGTTSDNTRVLPFKSAFFSTVELPLRGKPIPVQPVAIKYTRLNGMPIPPERREEIAWVGDAAFFLHLQHLLGLRRIEVEVTCLPPIYLKPGTDRKQLAARCREQILETIKNKSV